jgi:hypothetical protein
MFRMLKLKPPHGWNAVAWELVIVTIGVLMALFLQQWAEEVGSQSKTARARQAIKQELGDHFFNAVEWRTFSPCLTGQLERIERKIVASGPTLQPIEPREISKIRVSVMAPSRIYDASAWQGAINDGTAFQLSEVERRQLTNEHFLASKMDNMEDEWAAADENLLAATRSISIDPAVKLALLNSVDRMHVANERMDEAAAEIIFWTRLFRAAPSRSEVRADLTRNSVVMSYFCQHQGLPTRTLATALDPNS